MNIHRLDLVFDVYLPCSLKCGTREKRGIGTRTLVSVNSKIPKNWQDFLRVDENKTELFRYLADVVSGTDFSDKIIVVTWDDEVRCSDFAIDINIISPCIQEEADTRVILHCLHAAQTGSHKIAIRTVDTDVVVLAISNFTALQLNELWIHFGVGKNVRIIAAHDIFNALCPEKSKALPVFHCFTGCDTVSCLIRIL